MKVSERLYAVFNRHWDRSPAIKKYYAELYRDPHMRGLIERYRADKDLTAYLKGMFATPNFRKATLEAFSSADMVGMVTDFVSNTPPETLGRAGVELRKDGTLDGFVDEAGRASGLPVDALLGGAQPRQPR